MSAILERVAALELKVQGLEAVRAALEWLGATIQGQTEALNITVEEMTATMQQLEASLRKLVEALPAEVRVEAEALINAFFALNFGQRVSANHARRQEVRRQAAIQQSKDALKQLIDAGIVEETDTIAPGTMLIGTVTKGEQLVQEYESGIFENFPEEAQAAFLGKTVGVSWDGPKGVLKVEKIYTFKKSAAPKKTEGLAEQAAQPTQEAPAPAAETAPEAAQPTTEEKQA